MTMKMISATTLEKENGYMGDGDGSVYVLALQEALDTATFVREALEDTSIRASAWDGGDAPTLGLRQGEPALVVDLSGLGYDPATGDPNNDGGLVAADNDSVVIASAIGAAAVGTGTTCAAGWTTTSGDVDSAAGLAAGRMVMIASGDKYVAAAIADITGSTVTLATPLPVAPVLGAVLYAGITYTPQASPRDTYILEHHMDNDEIAFRARGVHMVPEFANLGAAEGKARLTLPCTVGDWERISSSLDTIDPPDTFVNPGIVQDDGYFVLTDGTNAVACLASTMTMSNLLAPMRRADACKANTVGEPEIIPSMDKQVVCEVWQASGATGDPMEQLLEWWESGEKLKLMYQVGPTPCESVAFYFPAVCLIQEPTLVDKGGIMAVSCTMKITLDRASEVFTRPWYFARF